MVIDPLIKRLSEKVNIHDVTVRRVQAHTSGFADDLAITVVGKIKNRLIVLGKADEAMKIVENWCDEVKLKVNPNKTFAMRFTKGKVKWEIDNVRIFGQKIKWVDTIKYLGVTLDKNLCWKPHIKEIITKSKRALFASRAMLEKDGGLSPKNMKWVLNQIITPRITYGAIVWWRVIEVKKIYSQLLSIQRFACMMISGATKTTPTFSLMNLLGIIPIDIRIKMCALSTCVRIMATKSWKQNNLTYSHTRIVDCIGEITDGKNFDCVKQTWNINNNFSIKANENLRWHDGLPDNYKNNCWFVDGAKNKERAAVGLWDSSRNVSVSYRLSDNSSSVQSEILAICICADQIRFRGSAREEVFIMSDSLSALKMLEKRTIDSKVVMDCRDALNKLGRRTRVKLIWVPGHKNIYGNIKADKAAKNGLIRSSVDVEVPLNKKFLMKAIERQTEILANRKWAEVKIRLKSAKGYIGSYNDKKSKELLRLGRADLRVIIGFHTGHGCCNHYLFKLNKVNSPLCRYCSDGKSETIEHWIEKCRGLEALRYKHTGELTLDNNKFKSIELSKLIKFAKESRIYETFFFWEN